MKPLATLLCCFGLLGAGTALAAQDSGGYDFHAKFRVQTGMKAEGGQRNGLGIDFGVTRKFGAGTLGLDLSYQYLAGKLFRADIPANSLNATQTNSVLTKRNTTDMLGLRAQYAQPLDPDWSWHAGLGLYSAKSRLETIGDYEATSILGGGASGAHPDGVWNTTPEKSGIAFMPFAGVSYRVSESGSLEFNVSVLNYKQADVEAVFTGLATTPANDYKRVLPQYGSKGVTDIKFEIAYTVHF